ncbi:acyl-CoA dehydrogenase family protein [Geodermatophilus sp. SYSU D00710]
MTLRDETADRTLLRDTAARFAARQLAPAVARAERETGGHLGREEFRSLVAAAADLGLTTLLLPEEHGGGGGSQLDNAVVAEELGAVDVGFAAALNLTATVPGLLAAAGTPEQQRRWFAALTAPGGHLLAGALNEPSVAGAELFSPVPDPAIGVATRARRDGGDYVVSGAKAQWVTNAGAADTYLVFARTDPAVPAAQGVSVFWVPADAPGLVVGPRTSLLGMRSGWHAELVLDDVRVPADARIGPEGGALPLLASSTPGMVVGLAAALVGLARAALEQTLAFVEGRRSWGQPLRSHQAVALKLAEMAADLHTARLVVHDAARAVDRLAAGEEDPAALAARVPLAKVRAVDVAIANAQRAVELHGGAGVTAGGGTGGSAPERLLRDAWTGYSCDFPRDVLMLGIAATL